MRAFAAGALTVVTVTETDAHGCLWVLFPVVAGMAAVWIVGGVNRQRKGAR